MVTKEEAIKELHNQGELRRTTTRVLKRRDLKVSATIAGRRAHMFEDGWSKKKSVKSNVTPFNMEMEEEWDANVLCPIEEDELALMTMMGEHIGYEDD